MVHENAEESSEAYLQPTLLLGRQKRALTA